MAFPSHIPSPFLQNHDPEVASLMEAEYQRQHTSLELIASENRVSQGVLEAMGSVFTNKYAEGYPGKRYYGGCNPSDAIEELAQERCKALFKASFANVQPHSGSQANQAVFFALLQPGDTFLALSLAAGGHLTHGASVNLSGSWFRAVHYTIDPETQQLDYDAIEALALQTKPKLIIAGGSAYPRIIDFARFRVIAEEVDAILMVDMAHIAGLVAAEAYPSPIPHAHVVTSTTHKTLRGPRGGIILTQDADIATRINRAIFPGLQGGPLMHTIAAKAVCFQEALDPSFKAYGKQVICNAKALAKGLQEQGLSLISGGTDSHLVLMDLRSHPYGNHTLNGKDAQEYLERAGIITNKNSLPFDPLPPTLASGLRLGSPAETTRGLREAEFHTVAHWIHEVLRHAADEVAVSKVIEEVRSNVTTLCDTFT